MSRNKSNFACCFFSQGIGRATAIKFAIEGCHVIATDIQEEKLKTLEYQFENIIVRRIDVLNQSEIDQLAEEFKNADILFNCVG